MTRVLSDFLACRESFFGVDHRGASSSMPILRQILPCRLWLCKRRGMECAAVEIRVSSNRGLAQLGIFVV